MPLLPYVVQSGLYAALLWIIYCLVWRNRLWHRGSRAFLLMSMALPLVLPLIRLPETTIQSTPVLGAVLPAIHLGTPQQSSPQAAGWTGLFVAVYAAGCALLTMLYAAAYVRLYRALKTGHVKQAKTYTLVTGTGVGPGSIGRTIFFPGEAIHPAMLRHEEAHLRAGHRFDTVLLQVFHVWCWMSPAHWLLGRELKAIHEFEADQLATAGMERNDYAALLLTQTMGLPPAIPTAHFFFYHPLKRRIAMLQKNTPAKRPTMLLAALLLTTSLTGAALLAQTKKANKPTGSEPAQQAQPATTSISELLMNQVPVGQVSLQGDGMVAFRKVEQMPEFNGNMYTWLTKNVHYQDAPEARLVQKPCVVQFVVAEDGTVLRPQVIQSCGSARLDAEAVRAIGAMPAWKPGLQNGKPVSVIMVQSIGFGENGISGC